MLRKQRNAPFTPWEVLLRDADLAAFRWGFTSPCCSWLFLLVCIYYVPKKTSSMCKVRSTTRKSFLTNASPSPACSSWLSFTTEKTSSLRSPTQLSTRSASNKTASSCDGYSMEVPLIIPIRCHVSCSLGEELLVVFGVRYPRCQFKLSSARRS